MKIRLLGMALVLCFIASSAFFMTACNEEKAQLKLNQNIATSADAILQNLTDNIYNKIAGTSTEYSVEQIKNIVPNFNYYVQIGELENVDDVRSITLGNTKFMENQIFSLSIGNANYIVDKVFYENDDKLYVAVPIVAFEAVNSHSIKVNKNTFNLDLGKTANTASFTNVTSQGAGVVVSQNQNNGYDLTFNDAKTYISLVYDGLTADDVLITKRETTKDNNTKISYGLTKIESGKSLDLYPIGYSNKALDVNSVNSFDGASMVYTAYIIGGNLVSTTLNFNINVA